VGALGQEAIEVLQEIDACIAAATGEQRPTAFQRLYVVFQHDNVARF